MSTLTTTISKQLEQKKDEFIYFEGKWYSTMQAKKAIKKIQTAFRAHSIQPGDRIFLSLPNSYGFVIFYLAIVQYGGIVIPLDSQVSAHELSNFLKESHPVAGIAPLTTYEQFNKINLKTIPSLKQLFFSDDQDISVQNTLTLAPIIPQISDKKTTTEFAEETLALILYTSGTTGHPKEVGFTHRQIYLGGMQIVESQKLTTADRVYIYMPFFHINAQIVCLWSTCLAGGSMVISRKFSASHYWQTLAETHATWASIVPAVVNMLLNTKLPDFSLNHLKYLRSASSPLPRETLLHFEEVFQIPIVESYGMTEATSQICINPLPPEKGVPGSVGRPTGLAFKIIDEQGKEVSRYEQGEIIISGERVIKSYLKAENQDDIKDGWFYTGDIAYQDNQDFVYIIGRKKELINVGGEKVSPYEVEQLIETLAFVDKVGAVGLPDPLYGEKIAVAVTLKEQTVLTEAEMLQQIQLICEKNLVKYKRPKKIEFVETLPIGPTSKIQHGRLKKQLVPSQKNGS